MCADAFVSTIVHKFGGNDLDAMNVMADFIRVQLTLWPSSILGLMMQNNGSAGDDYITAVAILLNMPLYVVVGLVIRFAMKFFRRLPSGRGLGARAPGAADVSARAGNDP